MKDNINPHTEVGEVEILTDNYFVIPTDSTSVNDIRLITDKTMEMLADPEVEQNVDNYLNSLSTIDHSEIHATIAVGKEIDKAYAAEINRTRFSIEGTYFSYAVKLGKLLNALKILVNKANLKWGPWAATNLFFANERTRINYMLLAANEDIHQYGYLGIERSLHVLNSIKDMKGKDRVGKFLSKYEIEVNPEEEGSLEKFKFDVDAAVATEKLSKQGVEVSFEKVKNATAIGIKFDKERVKYTARLSRDGGNAETYLDNLIVNLGHEPEDFINEKRLMDFGQLIVRMD